MMLEALLILTVLYLMGVFQVFMLLRQNRRISKIAGEYAGQVKELLELVQTVGRQRDTFLDLVHTCEGQRDNALKQWEAANAMVHELLAEKRAAWGITST